MSKTNNPESPAGNVIVPKPETSFPQKSSVVEIVVHDVNTGIERKIPNWQMVSVEDLPEGGSIIKARGTSYQGGEKNGTFEKLEFRVKESREQINSKIQDAGKESRYEPSFF